LLAMRSEIEDLENNLMELETFYKILLLPYL